MNLGMTTPEGLTHYDVKRTTTDKLEELLNAYGDGWAVQDIVHVGGRDWVVIAVAEYASYEEREGMLGIGN